MCEETSRSWAQANAAPTSSTNSSAGEAADVRESAREYLDGTTMALFGQKDVRESVRVSLEGTTIMALFGQKDFGGLNHVGPSLGVEIDAAEDHDRAVEWTAFHSGRGVAEAGLFEAQ